MDFARRLQVPQRFEHLNRSRRVGPPPLQLQQVDLRRTEFFQRAVDGGRHFLSRRQGVMGAKRIAGVDADILARALAPEAAQQFLAARVAVRCFEGGDAGVRVIVQRPQGDLPVQPLGLPAAMDEP